MPWIRLWQNIRHRVDALSTHRLTLTIDEIRTATGSSQNLDKLWWWEMMNKMALGAVPPRDHGLTCHPHVIDKEVYAVTFARRTV
jgi:hypothetical protein